MGKQRIYDPVEIRSILSSELEYYAFERHANYLKNCIVLKKVLISKNWFCWRWKQYKSYNLYRHNSSSKRHNNLIYDWRVLFLVCFMITKEERHHTLHQKENKWFANQKRQYKIKNENWYISLITTLLQMNFYKKFFQTLQMIRWKTLLIPFKKSRMK